MGMQQMVDDYLAGRRIVSHAVAGMNPKQFSAHPVPGKWSTLEVVCHLCDFEQVYADRMKRIIAEDQPLLVNADENRFAAALAYDQRDLEEELDIIELTRQQLGRILRTLPDEALSRTGIYRRAGHDEPRTLEKLLTDITSHIPHHVKFILEKRQALGMESGPSI
jgi:hypothetical protein